MLKKVKRVIRYSMFTIAYIVVAYSVWEKIGGWEGVRQITICLLVFIFMLWIAED